MPVQKTLAAAIVCLFLSTGALFPQSSSSSIVGDIADQSGAAVPGAQITVTDKATGISRETVAAANGSYRVYPLHPGTYDVKVSSAGFQTQLRGGIQLLVGTVLELKFSLQVGQVTETVEVNAAAPLIQTQEASVGGVIDSKQLERIPVNGRNYTRLMVLMPGTSDIRRSQARGTEQGTQLISVNGQRSQDNNFTLDGADSNIMMQNSPGGSPRWIRSRSFA
jgi:hypothetical protein